MEISLFIIGTFISIIVIMVIGVSINYVAFKSLQEEVDKLNIASDHGFKDIYKQLENTQQELHSRITKTEQSVVRHTDSKVDQLENKIKRNFDLYGQQGKPY
jgi:uncharacterized membrane-anchored protein YhcB (DUF1043 family)|tara:strand:- start:1805 stop:2110 length:306 start_codon:yes stop_codon:yes gene_type:complete